MGDTMWKPKGTVSTTTMIDGKVVRVTKFPPGAAYGAHTLHSWAVNRSGGLSGSNSWLDNTYPSNRNKRKKYSSKKRHK